MHENKKNLFNIPNACKEIQFKIVCTKNFIWAQKGTKSPSLLINAKHNNKKYSVII